MEKKTCCFKVYSVGSFYGKVCVNKAKVERVGKWYCGTHDPVAVNTKRNAKEAGWQIERERVFAAQESKANAAAEVARRAGCFDDLVAALKYARRMVNASECDISFIDAAITKATGADVDKTHDCIEST